MSNDEDTTSWRPSASIDTLRLRAALFEQIRLFFKERHVLEVDTPVLSAATTPDPHIHSFETRYSPTGEKNSQAVHYLSTSPEFHMKRLLAAGSGSIYQLCHVFRQGEYGKQHNPEFSMLEWYRIGMDYRELMQEVAELIAHLTQIKLEIEIISYQRAFLQSLAIDPLNSSLEALAKLAESSGLVIDSQNVDDRDLYLDFLMSHHVQPKLGLDKLTFVHEYPASQSAYAKISTKNTKVAERFELFYQGVELANGYQEVTDPQDQQYRFEQQSRKREMNHRSVQWDSRLVAALAHGMPRCSGVALGVDRLIQLILNVKNIEDVLAFAFNRA